MLDLDFSGVPRSNTLDEGDYIFMISDAEIVDSKSDSSSKNFKVTLEVLEPTESNGRKLTQWLSLKQEALWSTRRFFEAVIGEELDGQFTLNPSMFPGNKVGATVEIDGDFNKVTAWFVAP